MTYLYNFPNITTGVDEGLRQTVNTVPSFTYWMLLFVFGVVALGGMIAQKRRLGYIDLPWWFLWGGIADCLICTALSLIPGLMSVTVFGIVGALTLAFAVWFFLDRRPNETS